MDLSLQLALTSFISLTAILMVCYVLDQEKVSDAVITAIGLALIVSFISCIGSLLFYIWS